MCARSKFGRGRGRDGGDRGEGLAHSVGPIGAPFIFLKANDWSERARELNMQDTTKVTSSGCRMLGHGFFLMRPGMNGCHLLTLDGFKGAPSVEGLFEHDLGANRQGSTERHANAGRPEERLSCQNNVVGPEFHKLSETPALYDRCSLAVQDPLRERGCTGGVDDHRVVDRVNFGGQR